MPCTQLPVRRRLLPSRCGVKGSAFVGRNCGHGRGHAGVGDELEERYAVSRAGLDLALFVGDPGCCDVEDDSAVVTYSGTWLRLSSGSYSGGAVNRGGSAGAYADIPYYGSFGPIARHPSRQQMGKRTFTSTGSTRRQSICTAGLPSISSYCTIPDR